MHDSKHKKIGEAGLKMSFCGRLFRINIPRSLLILAILINIGCAREAREPIKVGSKSFTENTILGEIAMMVAGRVRTTVHQPDLGGSSVLFQAVQAGDIDVYPEYSGTIAKELLHGKCAADYQSLSSALAPFGLKITRPLGFNNTYAFGVRREMAEKLNLKRISDLTKHKSLSFGLSSEFLDRDDGWPGVKKTYGIQSDAKAMEHQLCYSALKSGSIDVMDLYSTDAEIQILDLVVLEDDQQYFPRYDALFLYRADLWQRAPKVARQLESMAGQIQESEIIQLNAKSREKTKGRRRTEREIVYQFLQQRYDDLPDVKVSGRGERIWLRTREHLFLVFVSLFLATLTAIPLGYFAHRFRRSGQLSLGIVGVVQTIPSLALLVFMIPLLGTGEAPAIIALYLYSLLPIMRGTYLGFSRIPQSIIESAQALGLTPGAQVRLIEFPLALPAILSGLKTAAVLNIGTATLGAAIGAGGYGLPIFAGIRRLETARILEGAIPAALLALVAQGLFEIIERKFVSPGLSQSK